MFGKKSKLLMILQAVVSAISSCAKPEILVGNYVGAFITSRHPAILTLDLRGSPVSLGKQGGGQGTGSSGLKLS